MTRPSPRLIVLGMLMACFAWALIIPLSLTAPRAPLLIALNIAGLTVYGAATLLVLRASVNADLVAGRKWLRTALLVTVTLALWAPVHIWREPGEQPWAWMAGFAIAACALLNWQCGVVAGITLGAAGYIGGAVFDGSVTAGVLTAFACALVVWTMCHTVVWMLRLLWAAQAGRQAQSDLAIARERLRVSRELHDVLGHRLSIIALKAELAADLAGRDPERAAAESEQIRRLTADTLAEARRTIRGHAGTDLLSQLRAAELVLGSAGIAAHIDAPHDVHDRLPKPCSELMAVVTREALTNALRHSDATQVAITLTRMRSHMRLSITNDGVRDAPPQGPSDGTGLVGLSARCAELGARLAVARTADFCFEVCVEYPNDLTAAR